MVELILFVLDNLMGIFMALFKFGFINPEDF